MQTRLIHNPNHSTATSCLKNLTIWGHTVLGALECAASAAGLSAGLVCLLTAITYVGTCPSDQDFCAKSLSDVLVNAAAASAGIGGGLGLLAGGMFAYTIASRNNRMTCEQHAELPVMIATNLAMNWNYSGSS